MEVDTVDLDVNEILKIISRKELKASEIEFKKLKMLKESDIDILKYVYNFFCVEDFYLYNTLSLEDPYDVLNERICKLNIETS